MESHLISEITLSESLSYNILIDGISVVSETLNFLRPTFNIKLSAPFFSRNLSKKELKGIRFHENLTYSYSTKLFISQDFIVSFIVTSNSGYLEYRILENLIRSGIEKTFLMMKNTSTYELFQQSSFASSIYNFNQNTPLKVLMCDYKLFSDFFQYNLNILFAANENFTESKFFFFACRLGQSMELNYMLNMIKYQFNENEINEILLHLAFDFKSKNNSVIFIRKQVLKRLGKPNYEYYPMAIEGSGNYYYDYSKNISHQSIYVSNIKFYKEFNKHIHHTNAFKQPSISYHIMEFLENTAVLSKSQVQINQMKLKQKKYLTQLSILERVMEGLDENKTYKGRMEVMISSIEKQSLEKLVDHAISFLSKKDLLSPAIIYELPTYLITQRFQQYIRPCINLLSQYLTSISQILLSSFTPTDDFDNEQMIRIYNITIDDYKSLLAAESIIAFFIYGQSISHQTERRHNNLVSRDIGLLVSNFRTKHVHIGNLKGADRLSLNNGVLCYKPKCDLDQDPYFKKIFNENTILSEIYNFCMLPSASQQEYRKMSTIFFNLVIKSCIYPTKVAIATPAATLRNIKTLYKDYKIIFFTTYEFLCYIFNTNDYRIGHHGIQWICNFIQSQIKSDLFNFIFTLNKTFTENLLNESTGFAFPIKKNRTIILVTPVTTDTIFYQSQIDAFKKSFSCCEELTRINLKEWINLLMVWMCENQSEIYNIILQEKVDIMKNTRTSS